MKRFIDPIANATEILGGISQGCLLTTKADGPVNTMSISWGTMGIEWNKPIVTVFVRGSRHTKGLLDKNPEFTVNIPVGQTDKRIISLCGSKSGRDLDKIKELGLTTVEPEIVSVPAIQELPLTLECRVIYRQKQDLSVLPPEILNRFYPVAGEHDFRDYHIAYYGEILNAYLVQA
jgi:flavin reductase (DIM6/NTAB) family NADH-FMN oxidoreductase RutF